MHDQTGTLIQTILGLPIFRSEWVLYLLLFLSLASIGVMLERWAFFQRRKLDSGRVRDDLSKTLDKGDFEGAAGVLKKHDALETNVVLVGLQSAALYWWVNEPNRALQILVACRSQRCSLQSIVDRHREEAELRPLLDFDCRGVLFVSTHPATAMNRDQRGQ